MTLLSTIATALARAVGIGAFEDHLPVLGLYAHTVFVTALPLLFVEPPITYIMLPTTATAGSSNNFKAANASLPPPPGATFRGKPSA